MTDDTKDEGVKPPKKSNVKPLHKGIVVDNKPEPVFVDKNVVDELESLLNESKQGNIVGLVYTTANKDYTSDYNIVGSFPVPDRTQNVLRVLDDDFYEFITRPLICGTGDLEEYD